MLKGWQWWVLSLLALVALALVGANIWLFGNNRAAQAQINAQAQFVQQTVQLDQLYREIVKALAQLSVRAEDSQVRDLLAQHGFTVNVAPPAAAPAPAAGPNPDAAATPANKAKR